MKKVFAGIMAILIMASICACNQKAPTWQEEHDLGVRYLEEGNYEEAIIAFTAAIEIDPKKMETYSGLSGAYLAMGETAKAAAVWQLAQTQDLNDAELAAFTMRGEQHQKLQEFWESGKAGICIVSLSFGRETYLAGEETTFSMTAFYRCAEGMECHASLSMNIENAASRKHIGEDIKLTGSGIKNFSGTAAPVQWGNRYFAVSLDMWSGDDSGQWIGGDTWYITPNGEIVNHYAPINEYGGTEFTGRYRYQDFSNLEAADQRRIGDIAEATIEGNRDTLLSLLNGSGLDGQILTIWNGYKMEIHDQSTWITNNDQDAATDHYRSFSIEMRPQSGTGYVCYVHDSYTENTSGKDDWMDFSRSVRVISCPCDNWQWNGSFTEREWNHFLWRSPNDEDERRWYHTDYTTSESYEDIFMTGTMNMNVRNGTATMTTHLVANWSAGHESNNGDSTWTDTYNYQNGVLIEKNGEPWDGGKGYQLIDGQGGGVSYSDELLKLDTLFW